MGDLYNPFPRLPKNIRQIGETDQVARFYMEDYVNTYLKRLYPAGNQTMRAGLLLGTTEQHDGTPYIFVDGALEMEEIETDGEKISFSDSAWKKAYQAMEEAFPKRTIQGWFLCGSPSSQLSPLNYWKQHIQYFSGKNQLMYLNHGLEGEEAVYVTSEDGFYRLKGHCIYYERNQLMQDYMITRKDVHRVETGSHETVIKDFRQRMSVKKEEAMLHHRKTSFLGMVCGSLSVAILAGGVVLVNNYAKMQKMESVLTSVLPQGMSGWSEYAEKIANEPDFIIEEIKGNVYPTEALQTSADESGSGEVSGTGSSISGSGGAAEGTPGMAEAAAGSSETGSGEEPKEESGAEAGSGASATAASEQRASGQGTSGPAASEAKAPTGSTELGTSGSGSSMAGVSEKEAGAGASAGAGFTESGQSLVGFGKGSRVYEVGPGETLYGICWKEYGDLTQLGEICRLNGLEDENRILAGQALILP